MFFLVNEELLLSFFQLMRNLIRSHYLASDISPIYPPQFGRNRILWALTSEYQRHIHHKQQNTAFLLRGRGGRTGQAEIRY